MIYFEIKLLQNTGGGLEFPRLLFERLGFFGVIQPLLYFTLLGEHIDEKMGCCIHFGYGDVRGK